MGREIPKPDPLAPPLGIGCDLGDLDPPTQSPAPPPEPSEEGDEDGEKTVE